MENPQHLIFERLAKYLPRYAYSLGTTALTVPINRVDITSTKPRYGNKLGGPSGYFVRGKVSFLVSSEVGKYKTLSNKSTTSKQLECTLQKSIQLNLGG